VRQVLARLSYANVMATLAFFLAVSGATAFAASTLLTGADIRDGSITGADVRNHTLSAQKLRRGSVTGAVVRNQSLTGSDLKDGSVRAADFDPRELDLLRGAKGDAGAKGEQGPQGPQGAQGPPGEPGSSAIERASWQGSDMNGYVNGTTIIDRQVPTSGGWLMLAHFEVTNTSGPDDWFNCGLFVGGQQIGGGGDNIQAGTTRELNAVGFGPADADEHVVVQCESGGSGTFDIANVSLSLAKLM
jgi:uncharacterized protein YjbI with pentapeptide repeats